MSTRPTSKKATNLSIRYDLLYEAKALKISLSQAFETHLAELVKAKKQAQWQEKNSEAINANNKFVNKNGVFSDGWRSF